MKEKKHEETALSLATVYLEKAMQAPGCPICRRVREAEERWIWNVLYELTGDPKVHERFATSFGLCREHAALMAQVVETRELVTPTGTARLYESAVAHVLHGLANFRTKKGLQREECPVCVVAEEAEERESWFLGKLLADPAFCAAYEKSDGLCLPHFLSVWSGAPKKVRAKLLADFQGRLARLLVHLRELQRKERFDVHEPPTPEEIASWREALWRLGGMSYPAPLIRRG
ncbi:MAG: hypothetical protein NZ651_05720 [Candidatus Bipolaricaulota bacterium]|nr:hypothetical protein [Candidatus Bipolaricaulota bacterium]MDW8127251.1 hypothetical protein [Candidatus Bipolaricaulota bacterium]